MRSFLATTALLVIAFALLVWPHIASRRSTYDFDGVNYYQPTIRDWARTWPAVDLAAARAAGGPLVPWLLAAAPARIVDDLPRLRSVSSLGALALLVALHAVVSSWTGPWRSAALVAPLLGNQWFLVAAAWLLTDDWALLFATLAIALVVAGPERASAARAAGLLAAMALATATRQFYVWLAISAAACFLLASPLRHRLASALGEPLADLHASRLWLAAAVALGPPLVVLGLIAAWGGLAPPRVVPDLKHGSPAAVAMCLAVLGVHAAPYLAALRHDEWALLRPRDPWTWGLPALAVLAALVPATSFDDAQGRSNGLLWRLVAATPSVGHRSLLIAALAGLCGLELVLVWRVAARARGERDVLAALGAGLLGWALVHTQHPSLQERYFDGVAIVVASVAAARLLANRERQPSRLALAAPLAFAVVTGTLAELRLFGAVR